MNAARVTKLLSRYSSGVVTASEVAYAVLTDLVADAQAGVAAQPASLELPGEVRAELLARLREIRAAGYRWQPFMIGSGEEPDPDPKAPRWLCAQFGVD